MALWWLFACLAGEGSPECAPVLGRPAGWDEARQGSAGEPDYDAVFSLTGARRIELRADAEAWAAMSAQVDALAGDAHSPDRDGSVLDGEPPYLPVDARVGETTWCGVGFRFKGNSSLVGAWRQGSGKLPFRLDFDHYEDERPELRGQRLDGFDELSFANGWFDPTLLREVLADELLADAGVPVARAGFWWVTLDLGEGAAPLGLYVAQEDPADTLVARVWGYEGGNLYKPEGACATLGCFEEASFAKKSNLTRGDWSDARALVDALELDGPGAVDALGARLDVDAFLRWLAVNAVLGNRDVYGTFAHNYYLYGVPADGGRFAWIPWDQGLSWIDLVYGSDDPLLADVGPDWPLVRRVLDDPAWAARYREFLADALESAEGSFDARLDERAAVVGALLWTGEGEPPEDRLIASEAEFEAGLEELRTAAAARRAEVGAVLGR